MGKLTEKDLNKIKIYSIKEGFLGWYMPGKRKGGILTENSINNASSQTPFDSFKTIVLKDNGYYYVFKLSNGDIELRPLEITNNTSAGIYSFDYYIKNKIKIEEASPIVVEILMQNLKNKEI